MDWILFNNKFGLEYYLIFMKFKEKHALFLLAILFIFTTIYISSFPYDLKTSYTVPDEKAYYDWALIFAKGKYYIPVEEIELSIGVLKGTTNKVW